MEEKEFPHFILLKQLIRLLLLHKNKADGFNIGSFDLYFF